MTTILEIDESFILGSEWENWITPEFLLCNI